SRFAGRSRQRPGVVEPHQPLGQPLPAPSAVRPDAVSDAGTAGLGRRAAAPYRPHRSRRALRRQARHRRALLEPRCVMADLTGPWGSPLRGRSRRGGTVGPPARSSLGMIRIAFLCCGLAILSSSVPSLARAAVTVSPSPTAFSTSIGGDFTFSTRVDNKASTATRPLVAHLNVLSLRPGVYVDPEDWSSRRTVFIGSIPARGSRLIDWKGKGLNSGGIRISGPG